MSAVDEHGRTLLHKMYDFETMKRLLELGVDVNARNSLGIAPLHYAPNGQIVDLLVKHGADVNILDFWGCTPLDLSHKEAHAAIIKHGGRRTIPVWKP